MMLLSEKIIDNYLMLYLKNKWSGMQREASQYPERRFPFVIEEAVLNTALTGSIFRYMHEHSDHSSTLVSEAKVKRYGTDKGRCDIIWYSGDSVHYIELKGVFLYNTAEASLKAAVKCLNEAVDQVYSIVSDSIAKADVTQNEQWYGFAPRHRYGFVGGLLFSDINSENNKFSDYERLLNSGELAIERGIKLNVKKQQFAGDPLDVSYYNKEGKKTIKSDGYFFLCAEFEIL